MEVSTTDRYTHVSDTSTDNLASPLKTKTLSYKIVGDNIDFNIVPRYMRIDHKVNSLHYFHSYAVCDRISVENLPYQKPPSCLPSSKHISKMLLPTPSDDGAMINNIKIIFSRILCETLPFFNQVFSDLITKHIHHRRYSEMSAKSIIVSDQ